MANYHLLLGKSLDFSQIQQDAAADVAPGHVLADLAQRLHAQIHHPGTERISTVDMILGRIISTPQLWAWAHRLAPQLGADDIVFTSGEDVGIPLATACRRQKDKPKIIVTAHNLDRPRGRGALALLRCGQSVDLWLTNSQQQRKFLQGYLHLPPARVPWIAEQTDSHFFRPAATPRVANARPLIASVGLEQRDYRTLALATADLEVDVRISGFSHDAKALARAFPEPLPQNMKQQFYPWTELRQLYRQADVVVVSLFENDFCAGLTTFLEASACARPVVITVSRGLTEYVAAPGVALQTRPGEVQSLREAIVRVLQNRTLADELAGNAYQQVLRQHTPEHWLDAVEKVMRSVADTGTILTLPQGAGQPPVGVP